MLRKILRLLSKEEIVTFDHLPNETIAHIFSFLPDEDMQKNVPFVSSRFHAIAHEFFLDSLYGKSLRFSKWQNDTIKQLIEDTDQFIKSLQLSLMRPHADEQSIDFAIDKTGGIVAISSIAISILASANTYFTDFPDEWKSWKPYAVALLIVAAGLQLGVLGLKHLNVNRENDVLLADTIRREDFDAVIGFLQKKLPFVDPNVFARITSITNLDTLSDVLTALRSDTKVMEDLSSNLDDFLKTTKYSPKRFLNQDELARSSLDPKSQIYAKNMMTLWGASNRRNESLLKPAETRQSQTSAL